MADAPSADLAARGREAEHAASLGSVEPDWLNEARDRAKERLGELELPTQKQKGWEFTDLSNLDVDAYADGIAKVQGLEASSAATVIPLAEAATAHPELVRDHLGTVVPGTDIFTARNESRWRDGVLVHVPSGARLEQPLRLTVSAEAGTEVNWRVLIVLEEGAEAEVWERYASDGEALFNGVVELVVGDGANLRYVCEQELSEQSWVFATQRAEVGRDANLDWVALGFGSANGKVHLETRLAGPGSHAKVTGAYATQGRQHVDFDTLQVHAAPNTTSDLAFRGIIDGRSSAVWSGMIKVDPGAQQTDAFQDSRNLLLSKKAHADAIPGLEILANDVRCTHAAAIAQIDQDQLFYLRSRGLQESVATRLVIEGFLAELVERLAEGPIREAVAGALEARMAEVLGVGA